MSESTTVASVIVCMHQVTTSGLEIFMGREVNSQDHYPEVDEWDDYPGDQHTFETE